jgi:type IV secretion system protein VirD4
VSEQSRPLLQVEDIRAAIGGESALLESRDLGYFTVDTPNFWLRPELSSMLRDVRLKPDKYVWLDNVRRELTARPRNEPDSEVEAVLLDLRGESNDAFCKQ